MSRTATSAVGDGQALWRAMLITSPISLASALALLEEVKLWPLLQSRLSGAAGLRRFEGRLEARVQSHAATSHADLVLQVLGRLNATCKLPPRDYVSQRDFEDNAAEIVCAATEALRGQEKDFHGQALRELMSFQLGKIIDGVTANFEELSSAEQDDFVARLEGFVDSLPTDQRQAIQKALGADEFSRSILRKALIGGSLTAALVATSQIGGFAFYTGAVSMLSGAAGIFGITLPFAAYTGLTSGLAVLVNPIFLIIAGGSLAFYLTGPATNKLQLGLVPLVLTQIVAGSESTLEVNVHASGQEVFQEWSFATSRVRDIRQESLSAKAVVAAHAKRYHGLQTELAKIKAGGNDGHKRIKAERAQLRALALEKSSIVSSGAWGQPARSAGIVLESLQARVLKAQTSREAATHGWSLGWVRDTLTARQLRSESEQAAEAAVNALLEAVSRGEPISDASLVARLTEIRRAERSIAQYQKQAAELASPLEEARRELEAAKTTVNELRRQLDRAETRYWGLKQIA